MRQPVTHYLKCWPEYFQAVKSGAKPFEIRENDRDFRVGDIIVLREWHRGKQNYTGDELARTISYMTDWHQMIGYVVLGLSVVSLSDQGEATRLREALQRVRIHLIAGMSEFSAEEARYIVDEALSSSHREDGWIPADKHPAEGQYLVSDGVQVGFGFWMVGSDYSSWYAADAAPFLSEDVTHYRPIPAPPISIAVER